MGFAYLPHIPLGKKKKVDPHLPFYRQMGQASV